MALTVDWLPTSVSHNSSGQPFAQKAPDWSFAINKDHRWCASTEASKV